MSLTGSEHTAQPAGGRLSILVVEDDEANRYVAHGLLTLRGHSVDAAVDGPDAIEALAGRPYDVILLDIRLPGLDGFSVLQCVRSQAGGSAIRVVAVTADVFRLSRATCLSRGFDDYLAKPYTKQLLFESVERKSAAVSGG